MVPHCGTEMQIRLDDDIARAVKREADAHRRLFKRRKSYAAVANEKLRELFIKRLAINTQ